MKYILLLLPFFIFSQNTYQVKYKMTTLFDGLKNYDAKLVFSDSESYFEYKLSLKDTATVERQDEEGNVNITIPDKNTQKCFVDLRSKTTFELKYLQKPVLVKDTLSFPIWEITGENKLVNNFLCQKATTYFKGRNYEVWFTLDYPTMFGSWKLNGLPGLIIMAQDEKKEVFFEAIEINRFDGFVEKPSNSLKTISLNDYKMESQKQSKELEERLKALGDRNIKIDVKITDPKSIEIAN